VGEAVAPDGRCTPILLVVMVYEIVRGWETMFGSLSMSSMEQVVGMFCLGRRGGDMGDGGYVLYLVLHIGECGV
jgi:hypothetical protein